VSARFVPIVDRLRARYVVSGGCWLWTGSLRDGYGRIRINNQHQLAHRVSYETFVGPIPYGCQLDHLCRARNCVNPEHLEPVTCRDNIRRGHGHAALNATKTHCQSGHPYDQENTRVDRKGKRSCRACGRARWRRRQSGSVDVSGVTTTPRMLLNLAFLRYTVKRNPPLDPVAAVSTDRFRSKFVESESGCWIWSACVDRYGYGQFRMGGGPQLAHRVSFLGHVGPIPPGFQIDHRCRVRRCVNPAHLEAVSSRENTLRGCGVTSINARKTRCKRGHELPKPVYDGRRWRRDCNECRRGCWRADDLETALKEPTS